jgi:S1-C subfamily serine protease
LQTRLAERGPSAALNRTDKAQEAPKGDPKPVGSGTGFFISGDIIISNNHVVESCLEIRFRKRGAEIGRGQVVATNRGDDIAALRADKPNGHFLKLRIGVPVKTAESVLVFGYPLTGALSSSGNTTLGNVTALTGLRDDSRFIQISASVQPGNSGGPVLDEAGRLVGVIEGKLDALKVARVTGDIPQNVNFAIRASTLANFLEANRIPYEAATNLATFPNIELAEQAEAASVQLECWK